MNVSDDDIRIEKKPNGVETYIFDPYNPLNKEIPADDIQQFLKKYGQQISYYLSYNIHVKMIFKSILNKANLS